MKPEKFEEAKILKRCNARADNRHRDGYLKRHPEFVQFDFPKTFYFKIYNDRCAIHFAVIREEDKKFIIYFINALGQSFDKLEFKTKKQTQRALRRNKFYFSTNKKCPYLPITPIYIKLGNGKKSAPYSKGHLWNLPASRLLTKAEKIEHYKELEKERLEIQYNKSLYDNSMGRPKLTMIIVIIMMIAAVLIFYWLG